MLATRLLAALAVLTTTSLVAAHDDDDDDDCRCRHYDGPFSSVTVAPPQCTSPVGLCTHGLLTGEFEGTYDFTVATIAPDPYDPSAMVLTGTSVITTQRGQIFTNDVSVMRPMGPFNPSPFVTTAVISSGTHRYRHTTGQFVAAGGLTLATGQAIGSYTADLCRTHERR